MAEHLEIRVHSMFRRGPQSHNWDWIHILSFPVPLLAEMRFAQDPYKWVRYATSVVVGAQGVLSTVTDTPGHGMPNNDLPATSMDLYYHMTEEERNAMVPIDPDMEEETVYSSAATPERSAFSRQVKDRDETCVLTDMDTVEAAHLLRQSKGDDYIARYTSCRSRDPAGTDLVNEIDSVRNGILLNLTGHANFGKYFAFLVTPNFAMTSADVDPSSPPERKLCTAHVFVPRGGQYFGDRTIPPGSPIRMPAMVSRHYPDWPPNILFDAVYGGAVLHNFGTRTLREACKGWESCFFDNEGAVNKPEETNEAPQEEQAGSSKREDKQIIEHENRIAKRRARCGDSTDRVFDDLLILPYVFMPPERVKAFSREARKKRQKTEQRQLEEKVLDWAKAITPTDCAHDAC